MRHVIQKKESGHSDTNPLYTEERIKPDENRGFKIKAYFSIHQEAGLLSLIQKRLGRTILTVIAISVAIVMGMEIYLRVNRGFNERIEMMTLFGKELAAAAYAGIKHPMSTGNSDAVRKQLLDIREKMTGVEVFICDFNQEIIYATHEDKIKTKASGHLHNKAARQYLNDILETGNDLQQAFEEKGAEKKYLITMYPILNQPDCYHCHGSSRNVLGGMVIKMSTDQIYATITANTNRSIILSLLGIALIVVLSYVMLAKWVTRPIESLANKAKKFAEGDMSVSVDVTTKNEVGVLGDSFNYMVKRISSFSRELKIEVARKTMMLREKTLLLERANRELRELDRLKSAFLANMSHELRTPMNSIIGYTDLLLDGIDGPINEEQAKSLQKVISNARHLLQLINDILDTSKIESGKIELNLKELDLKNVVETVASTLQPSMAKKGLRLVISFDEGLPHIYADEDKVRQILMNLLSNAIKFTNEGEITISAGPSERGTNLGEPPLFIEICVEDSGMGIKDDDISKLFDKFSQLDISTIRQYEGTGLGLSIARGLVVLHKGAIWATSKYGKGSKFCFTLPMKKEMFERPAKPAIETMMAKGLAAYFDKPVDTFLKEPEYAGKPIKCWEYIHCGQTSCPAYGNMERRCWLIQGTHCKGTMVASYPEKVEFCKGCEIIERQMLETDEIKEIEDSYKDVYPGVQNTKKTVMVIDDNPEAIDIISKHLGDDYLVIGMLSGKGAVDKAKEIQPTVITLDIMMPEKDGWQVLRELKGDPETQDIPVIILSIVDDKQLGFSLGAAEYIVKPMEKQMLLHKLKNLEKTAMIKKILIVDNEPETVEFISDVFGKAGYQMSTAFNSEDALSLLSASPPDLIVLNPAMPEINSFDVIEYIKEEESIKNIPLIVLAQKDLSEKEIEYLNGRIRGILNKGSLNKEDLLKELRNTVGKMQYIP